MDNSDENKKILIIGIVVIIVILAIWFWPKGNKNPGNDTNEVPDNYLYTWTSEKYIYVNPETSESNEFYFDNYKFDFYEDEMRICYIKSDECEFHQYSIKDDRILDIEGESEISKFGGQYFLKYKDNYVLISKTDYNGESTVFKFIISGGEE